MVLRALLDAKLERQSEQMVLTHVAALGDGDDGYDPVGQKIRESTDLRMCEIDETGQGAASSSPVVGR
jgi:hypothetical protein